jgi:putative endopeptidase
MQRSLTAAAFAIGSLACLGQTPLAATAPASGIDRQYIDASVRPQDDIYQYVNGKWLADFKIPADKSGYDQFTKVFDDTQVQLRALVDGLKNSTDTSDPDKQKLAALYSSFMDEAALEPLGMKPLAAEFSRIDAITDRSQIPALIAHLNRIGVPAPYTPQVHQDAKDASRYVFDLGQDGLGMPDRDYYLQDEARIKQIRASYQQHVQKILALAGDTNAAQEAKDILTLETALAKVQWSKVENRDPIKVYNKFELAKLATLANDYNWTAYLTESGVQGKVGYLIVSQPSYITGVGKLLRETPLPIWKSYFRLRVLKA